MNTNIIDIGSIDDPVTDATIADALLAAEREREIARLIIYHDAVAREDKLMRMLLDLSNEFTYAQLTTKVHRLGPFFGVTTL